MVSPSPLLNAECLLILLTARLLYQEFVKKVADWEEVLRTTDSIGDTFEQEENYRKRRKCFKKKGDEVETYVCPVVNHSDYVFTDDRLHF